MNGPGDKAMNSNSVDIKCEVCGQLNSLNSQQTQKTFFYAACSNLECGFPLASLNQSATDYKPPMVRDYIAAVENWASERLKLYQALQSQKRDLEDRYNRLETEQQSMNLSVDTGIADLNRKTVARSQSNNLSKDVDQWLAGSRLISNIQHQLQDVIEKLTSLESVRASQSIEDEATDFEIHAAMFNAQNSNEHSSDIAYMLETEQLHAKKSQWLELYNMHLEQFTYQCEIQLVGATKETLEASRLNRLSQNSEALFKTGNGNYWLMLSDQQNVAFLMPNRKRIRFNQNVLDSVRVCFQLTHRSVEDLNFDVAKANFEQFHMLVPAVVDIVSSGLWRLRQKGVLLFPLKEVIP